MVEMKCTIITDSKQAALERLAEYHGFYNQTTEQWQQFIYMVSERIWLLSEQARGRLPPLTNSNTVRADRMARTNITDSVADHN